MKITIETKQLAKLVSKAGSVIPTTQTLRVLSYLKLEVTEDAILKIIGTDLDRFVTSHTALNAPAQPGTACLLFSALKKVLTNSNGTVEIEYNKDAPEAVFRSGLLHAAIPFLPAQEFPKVPQLKDTTQPPLSVASDALRVALKRSYPFISMDKLRYAICGTLFETSPVDNPGIVSIVSTDGRRLAHETVALHSKHSGEQFRFTVPDSGTFGLLKLLPDNPASVVRIRTQSTQPSLAVFEMDECTFTTKLVDAHFPKWLEIVPAAFKEAVTLPVKELKKAVQAMPGESSQLKFIRHLLTIHSKDRHGLQVSVGIAINYIGNEQTIAFNTVYLSEIIAVLNGDDACRFKMNDELTPGVFCKLNQDGSAHPFFVVLMPMRII